MAMLSAFITGLAGEAMSAEEWRFLQEARPCGLILFKRNCQSPEQVRALINGFKDAIGSDDLLILIDQEGGRVQRLQPPHWRQLPPAANFGLLYREDPALALNAARAVAQVTAMDLRALGLNTNCAPVLDLPAPGLTDAIGNRAFGPDIDMIVALGRAVAEGLMHGGVLPVMKHLPGHGRAKSDSHKMLPIVPNTLDELADTDFAPFRALNDLPIGMTAHILFTDIDRNGPATTSRLVVETVIRGEIGFDGLLLSDDLSMQALSGSIGERTRAVLSAGCDVALHCSGNLAEMRDVAASTSELDGSGYDRFAAALACRTPPGAFDVSEALAVLAQVLAVGGDRAIA
jgi:beta-N-acetylhexosaminidase